MTMMPGVSRRKKWVLGLSIVAVVALVLLIALAAFPWGALRGPIERRLAERLGRPVRIAAIERGDALSFHPVIVVRGVRIAQAGWAGPGDLVRIDRATVRFGAWPMLAGHFRPESVAIDGMALHFVRAQDGRKSWTRDTPRTTDRGGPRPAIALLRIANATIRYDDAKRDRGFTARLRADAAGVRIEGGGHVRQAPVQLLVTAAPINGGPSAPWPFSARISGQAVGMTLDGRMDGPLDIGHFSAAATAHGADLKLVDTIIEAGLPATQPVRLRARVRRDSPDWRIEGLAGTIGRSDIAGHGTIRNRDGRHRIDGAITANRFDFDDLSSNEGRARAAATRARFGRRLVPDTAIDLDNVARTDGHLTFDAAQLLWPGPSPFRSLHATLEVDHSRLTIAPLTLGLTHGRMTGTVTVDQRRGGPVLDVPAVRGRADDRQVHRVAHST